MFNNLEVRKYFIPHEKFVIAHKQTGTPIYQGEDEEDCHTVLKIIQNGKELWSVFNLLFADWITLVGNDDSEDVQEIIDLCNNISKEISNSELFAEIISQKG